MILQTAMTDQACKDMVTTPSDKLHLTSKHFVHIPRLLVNRITVYFSGLRFSILTEVKFKEFKDKLSFLRTFKDHRKI